MSRLPPLDPATLSPQARTMFDEVMRVRGQVRGPFLVWLANPELCDLALRLQDWFASRSRLERRLLELMILTLARRADARFAWYIHEAHAISHGISADVVEALRAGRTPDFTRDDERLVYDVTLELAARTTLTRHTYDRAAAVLGTDILVELVSAVGFYVMVAMTLNAFEAPVPDDRFPLPT